MRCAMCIGHVGHVRHVGHEGRVSCCLLSTDKQAGWVWPPSGALWGVVFIVILDRS